MPQKKVVKKEPVRTYHGGTDHQDFRTKRAAASADFQKNRKPHSIHRKSFMNERA